MRTLGIAENRLRVVHDGVNTDRFKLDSEAGVRFRRAIGLPQEAFVVGMVGNFKRQKDHATFIRMAARVLQDRPECHFLVAGGPIEGSTPSEVYAAEIYQLAAELKFGDCLRFLGSQKDMVAFYNACNVTALLSLHEGTPNAALESMACGKPVIASDVADNAIIIRDGEVGHIVPSKAWAEAASHAELLLGDSAALRRMGTAARDHVCREYTPARAAGKLAAIYQERHAATKKRRSAPVSKPEKSL